MKSGSNCISIFDSIWREKIAVVFSGKQDQENIYQGFYEYHSRESTGEEAIDEEAKDCIYL